MSQNTSSAVMAQRVEPPDSLDYFPTPPWATRALLQYIDDRDSCWEPACGGGDMVCPLYEHFDTVHASDVHDYGWGHKAADFLFPNPAARVEWIITNPPFRLAAEFAKMALPRATRGVALLVRTAFLESRKRYRGLFERLPPHTVYQFVERVPMVKGRLDPKASTATAYCWVVWRQPLGRTPTRLVWITPCRRQLERPGDYTERLMP